MAIWHCGFRLLPKRKLIGLQLKQLAPLCRQAINRLKHGFSRHTGYNGTVAASALGPAALGRKSPRCHYSPYGTRTHALTYTYSHIIMYMYARDCVMYMSNTTHVNRTQSLLNQDQADVPRLTTLTTASSLIPV